MCHVGTPIRATLVSISVGLVILFTTATIARVAEGPIDDKAPFIVVRRGEWWMWIGGSCGVAVVSGFVIGVPRLGAAAYTAIFIATQLATALVFDAIGAFGFDPIAPTGRRVGGVLLGGGAAVPIRPNLAPFRRGVRSFCGIAVAFSPKVRSQRAPMSRGIWCLAPVALLVLAGAVPDEGGSSCFSACCGILILAWSRRLQGVL